jgi:hypothetical protein
MVERLKRAERSSHRKGVTGEAHCRINHPPGLRRLGPS